MRKITGRLFVAAASLCLAACKKQYTCNCATIDVHQGFIHPATYTVKAKSKEDALSDCFKKYEASGNSGGLGDSCELQ